MQHLRKDKDKTMNQRLWILGASDPEMEAIKKLLTECGESIEYATLDGSRVRPGNAYAAPLSRDAIAHALSGGTVYLVECIAMPMAGRDSTTVREQTICISHHSPGDPGYGRPPSEFMAASSLGQVVSELARVADLPARVFGHIGPVGAAAGVAGDIGHHCGSACWIVTDRYRQVRSMPHDIALTAAADHCLAAAYRGECPGVDPDELMRWRIESRAQFQGRAPKDVLADVQRARKALRRAGEVVLGQINECPWHAAGHSLNNDCLNARGSDYANEDACSWAVARDLRGQRVRELPEASAREGLCFVADGLPEPDGRVKIVCQSGRPEQIKAFMHQWAPTQDLVDIYGDPARGFAGGYSTNRKGHHRQ